VGVLRKILALLLLSLSLGHALWIDRSSSDPDRLEVRILEKLFSDILQLRKVRIYVMGENKRKYVDKILRHSEKLSVVGRCEKADLVFIAGSLRDAIPEDCLGKVFFSTRKEHILKLKDCIGAFFWKKGRPNILLIRERLEEKGIEVPYEYIRFIEPFSKVNKDHGSPEV
jgi:small-conductance mechanosensitive channel